MDTRITDKFEPDPTEIAIASSSENEPILESVRNLAAQESSTCGSAVSMKWLCLLLTWIYENREAFPDTLALVEEIYADFDYPKELAPFVRYMPSNEPDLGSKERNEERMIAKLGGFIRDYWSADKMEG